MTRIRITVDKTKCIGSASCVVIAPKFFDLGEDSKSFPINPEVEVTEEELEIVKKATFACPVYAISYEEIQPQ